MKKEFIKPEIRRIELNLKENIASSASVFPFVFKMHSYSTCPVWETRKYMFGGGLTQEEWDSCYVDNVYPNTTEETSVLSVDLSKMR